MIASSQVNASLCSWQYALNEQLATRKFSQPWFSQLYRHQNFWTGKPKNIIFFQNTHLQFSRKNNSFHLNSIRCRLRHRCRNYRRGTTTKTQVFTSVQNSHRTLQLAVEKHSFLSKCWFTISYKHSSSFHLRTFTPKSSHVQIFLKLWLQLENDKIMLKT